MADEIIDLDAIAPEPKKIKFNNEIITVNPPKIGELMSLYRFSQQKFDDNTDYTVVVEEIKKIIGQIIPELADKELNISQIIALETLITQMSTPTQTEELTKAGIDITSEKKIPV